jgi:hypothetical protein
MLQFILINKRLPMKVCCIVKINKDVRPEQLLSDSSKKSFSPGKLAPYTSGIRDSGRYTSVSTSVAYGKSTFIRANLL